MENDKVEIDVNVVRINAKRIEKGLIKYLNIMDRFRSCDASTDYTFQRIYKGFYRVRRNDDFCRVYFKYMEEHKNDLSVNFNSIISHLYRETGRIEPSFSSKLLATINANAPVWDSHVLSQLSIKPPSYSVNDRLQATIETYKELACWYYEYLQTENANEIIACFDSLLPYKQLTSVKKIDLVLWCMGPKDK